MKHSILALFCSVLLAQVADADETYRVLGIAQPTDGETLRNIGGALDVAIEIEPDLMDDHVIDAIFDGVRRNRNDRQTNFVMDEVWRGAHTLQIVVLDSTGREVARSEVIRFFVHQTSLLNPNNPQTSPNTQN